MPRRVLDFLSEFSVVNGDFVPNGTKIELDARSIYNKSYNFSIAGGNLDVISGGNLETIAIPHYAIIYSCTTRVLILSNI